MSRAEDELRELSLRVARLEVPRAGSLVFSPTAVAATYRAAVQAGVVTYATLPQWFQASRVPHPVLELLRRPYGPDAPETEVQTRMERVAEQIANSDENPRLLLVGRSTTPTVGSRKPDLVGFLAKAVAAGRPRAPQPVSYSVMDVVLLGSLKHPRLFGSQGRFADADNGDVLGMLEDLMRAQPWRASSSRLARGVVFLCDGVHIVFFECTLSCDRSSDGLVVQLVGARECGPLPLDGVGAELLMGLLATPADALGYTLPSVRSPAGDAVELTAYLGAGATAQGFAGRLRGGAVVAKRYHATTEAALAQLELEALKAVQGVPGVCQLLGHIDDGLLLAPLGVAAYSVNAQASAAAPVQPAGLWSPSCGSSSDAAPRAAPAPVVLPGADEFCDLVDALAGLHAAGWVHRDPRPANFFRDAAGRFFLADLGSAARIGDAAAAAADTRPWAPQYGPLAALRATADGLPPPAPEAAHDFEQVARLVYAAQARDADMLTMPADDAAKLAAWWAQRDARALLRALLPAAAAAAQGAAARRAFQDAIRRELS